MNRLLEYYTGIWLLDPCMILLLLLLPLALGLHLWHGRPAVRFTPGDLLVDLPRSWRVRLLWLPRALQIAGLVLVVIALARPVVRTPLPRKSDGIDILLCIDTSSSMAAKDMDPLRSRLDVAKDAAARFIKGRPHDRIGLIRFARYPDLLCPLTLDHLALGKILSRVEQVEHEGPEDVTGIGTAVARATQLLEQRETKSKVLILLTDGAENVATAQTPQEIGPERAGHLCAALAVRVYAIAAGIGKRSPGGQVVPIDTKQIEVLARVSGGRFFQARDAGAMAGVYANIDGLEKVEREEPRYRVEERFLLCLLLALGLLFLGRLLAVTVLEVQP